MRFNFGNFTKKEDVIDIKPKGIKNVKLPYGILLVALLIFLLAAFPLTKIWFTVPSNSSGVLWTLGRISGEVGPGIHFKLPYPIQRVNVIETKTIHRIEVGFQTTSVKAGNPQYTAINREAKMLTGDENIAFVYFIVQYQIVDPVSYVRNLAEPDSTVKKSAEAAMRYVIGHSKIDDALTDGKELIQEMAKEVMQETVSRYNAGIIIQQVALQDVFPPSQVEAAFNEVVQAKEARETKINNAQEYQNSQIPIAQGQANQMVFNAQGYYTERVNRAKGDVSRFSAILEEYSKAKAVTESRMYFEMIQRVLPHIKEIYIMDDNNGNSVKYLPLRQLQ